MYLIFRKSNGWMHQKIKNISRPIYISINTCKVEISANNKVSQL